MNSMDIAAILPHREPMLLVDQVLHFVEGQELVARKRVASVAPGHYAGLQGNADTAACEYPAMLVLESWCQAGGILAASRQPSPDVLQGKVMLVTSVTNARQCAQVRPGDVIDHRVRLVRAFHDALTFAGDTTRSDGQTVLTVERMVMTMRPVVSLLRSPAREETV